MIEEFIKEKKEKKTVKIFIKNFPADKVEKDLLDHVTKICGDCKLKESDIFISRF